MAPQTSEDHEVKITTFVSHRYKRREYKKNNWRIVVNRGGDIEVKSRGTNRDLEHVIFIMINHERK